jgi:HEAT repeat protein
MVIWQVRSGLTPQRMLLCVALCATPAIGAASEILPIPGHIMSSRELVERVARGEPVGARERDELRRYLDVVEERDNSAVIAAWALAKLGDREALPGIQKAYALSARGHGDSDEAVLRRALQRFSKKQTVGEARRYWERTLLNDRNPIMRGDAVAELASLRHPRALKLLRAASQRGETAESRRYVLGRVAMALAVLGKREAVPDLMAMLGDEAPAYEGHPFILELEVCHTLDRRSSCPELEHKRTVDDCARKALELLTGERWPDWRGLRPVLDAVGRNSPVTPADRRLLRRMLGVADAELVSACAWALGRLGDVDAGPLLRRRLRELTATPFVERPDPEYKSQRGHWRRRNVPMGAERLVTEAFLRVALLKLERRPAAMARKMWAGLLLDPAENPYVRAEAAKEVVASGHPDALEMLQRVALEPASGPPYRRGALRSQVAVALGRLGPRSERTLQMLLGDLSGPGSWYAPVLGHDPEQAIPPEVQTADRTAGTVDGHARRALEKIRASK